VDGRKCNRLAVLRTNVGPTNLVPLQPINAKYSLVVTLSRMTSGRVVRLGRLVQVSSTSTQIGLGLLQQGIIQAYRMGQKVRPQTHDHNSVKS